jgi:cytochrome c1
MSIVRAGPGFAPLPAATPAALIAAIALAGCAPAAPNIVGDPRAGEIVIARSSCGSCHIIPGIALADGRVGPSLAGFGSRMLIAGTLPNQAPNLVLWLKHPGQIRPNDVMPDVGLTDRQARDAAAYLYELQ